MNDHIAALEHFFDRTFYLRSYPDVAELHVDPLEHYCATGWREGRNPSISFDTGFYLQRNPDVAKAGINPLHHYVFAGRHEGRKAVPPLRDMRARVRNSFRAKLDINPAPTIPDEGVLSAERLSGLLQAGFLDGPTILSVSHDDYRKNVGGVQKLISVEQATCSELSWNYLHLSPACPRLGLADRVPGLPVALSVCLNGTKLGNTIPASLIQALVHTRPKGHPVHAVIHHLMGHAPEDIGDILQAVCHDRIIVWTHDFFTLCSSVQLLRNDTVYCHAPPSHSMACGICSHGQDRPAFLARIETFFTRFTPCVMAPSEAALALWLKHASFSHAVALARPLGRLLLSDSHIPFETGSTGRPIRIAFLGQRAYPKGWPVFQNLAELFQNDPRYEFHHIGLAQSVPAAGHIIYTPVNIALDGPDAMIRAVVARNIDVVVNWSLWPETFCYAAYEALAGGAFLLAPDGEGNVPVLLRRLAPGQGLLLESEDELVALLATGKLSNILKLSCRQRGYLMAEEGSIAWLRDQPEQEMTSRSEFLSEVQDD